MHPARVGLLALLCAFLSCRAKPTRAPAPPSAESSVRGAAATAPRALLVEPGQPQHQPTPPGALGRLGAGRLVEDAGAVALSPDGRFLGSVSSDLVKIWDARSGLARARVRCGGNVLSLAFEKPGGLLRVLTAARTCSFAVPDGRRVDERPLEAGVVDGALSRDGARLVLLRKTPRGSLLAVLDAASGSSLGVHATPACLDACRLLLSPDAAWAGLTLDGAPLLVELGTGRRIALRRGEDPEGVKYDLVAIGSRGRPVWALAELADWAPADAAEVGNRPALREWSSPETVPQVVRDLSGEGWIVTDGDLLAGRAADRSGLLLRDLRSGQRRRLPASGDGRRDRGAALGGGLLAASEEGRLRIWELASGLERRFAAGGHVGDVHAVQLLADGETAVTIAGDRVLRRWRRSSGRLLSEVPLPAKLALDHVELAAPNDGRFVAIRDDERALVASWNGAMLELALDNNEEPLAVAVAPADDLIAVVETKAARVFRASGALVASLPIPASICGSSCPVRARFSDDGRLLAVAVFTEDRSEVRHGEVLVLDVQRRVTLRRLRPPSTVEDPESRGDESTEVFALGFSPDRGELAVAVEFERSRILRYDLASGRLRGSFRTRIEDPQRLTYREGELWVEARWLPSAKGRVAVHALESGREKRCLVPADDKRAATGAPSDTIFAGLGDESGVVLFWPAGPCPPEAKTAVEPPPPLASCPALPTRPGPEPRWTAQVELASRAEIPARLARPFPRDARIAFYDHEHDPDAARRRVPRTCAEYLALFDGGRASAYGGRNVVGAVASMLMVRCRTLALLAKARPARRSFLTDLRLDRDPLALLPPLPAPSDAAEAERVRRERVTWAASDPRPKVRSRCPTRLMVTTPVDETDVEILALGDFDGDGLEDVLLLVSWDASRQGGAGSTTDLTLATRRAGDLPLEVLSEWSNDY
jgi:WD40 repeat protein